MEKILPGQNFFFLGTTLNWHTLTVISSVISCFCFFPFYVDLNPSKSDPMSRIRFTKPPRRTLSSKGWLGLSATGGETAGTKPGCWQGPARNNHRFAKVNSGRNKSSECQAPFVFRLLIYSLYSYVKRNQKCTATLIFG